jgi:transposase
MTYSLDFRKKVLKIRAEESLSIEAVALRFGVGKASVMRWLVALEPKKQRNKPATKIDMALLAKDVASYPDSFQYERAQRFGVSASGIRLALMRLKISYKKNLESSQSR